MTAAQIAEIVGTERKAWWPEGIHFSGGGWWHWDHAGVPPELLEDAFIGAAVRELEKRSTQPVEIKGYNGKGGVDFVRVSISVGWDHKETERPTLLAALVAALNESEAP